MGGFGPAPVIFFFFFFGVDIYELSNYYSLSGWRLGRGIAYVLPLRVEHHIGQTHIWPTAGGDSKSIPLCKFGIEGMRLGRGKALLRVEGG